jgi:uncharacterized protein (DUF983 family)
MDEARHDGMGAKQWATLSPTATGLRGKCPRCGLGHIFEGFLKVRDHCEVCGLDYAFADPADGPAVFVQLFASVPGVVFLLVLEIVVNPPDWVLVAIGLPVVVLTTILPLRPIKGWLIAAQYTYKAQEAGTEKQWIKLNSSENPKDPGQSDG